MGKTSLMLNMILNDIYGGEGVCFIDPHGDAVETLLDYIPESRVNDVIYFNPADIEYPIPINILEKVPSERRHLLVSSVISIFRKLYKDYWHHRQEHILRNTLLALLEREEDSTLFDVYRMLSDWRFRKKVVEGIRDPVVKSFWQGEFSKYVYQFKGEALAPIQNKLGAFLTSPMIRNIVGQSECRVDFRRVIDQGKILLVNLAKGRVGEDGSAFFGAVIVAKLQLAAMSRIDVPEDRRRDFYLYVDEFHNFVANEAFEGILSEARKYRLCLTIAHQYLDQLDEQLRSAVFGNVGTIVSFPVGPVNGEHMERQYYPEFTGRDLVEHEKYHIYVKLAIDGKTSKPFSAITLPPFHRLTVQGMKARLIEHSRAKYSKAEVNSEATGFPAYMKQRKLFEHFP